MKSFKQNGKTRTLINIKFITRTAIILSICSIGISLANSPIMPNEPGARSQEPGAIQQTQTKSREATLSLKSPNKHGTNTQPAILNSNDDAVGTLPGDLSVAPTGAATYNIDLTVPPGTAGLTPKLSIQYNSQQKNGFLGMGFSLQGLTAITRASQNKAQNGKIHGVDYTDEDRFALGGQQLVATQGDYGQNQTEYHTYIDAQAKIISYDRQGNGPKEFKVWTKGGQVAEYGNTEDSRVKADVKKPDGTVIDDQTVSMWALDKIQDQAGNYLQVKYTKDDQENGTFYPQEIDYTANDAAGVKPYNKIEFSYEDRPDKSISYHSGSKTTLDKRLSDIKIYAEDQTGTSKLVYDYHLTYEQSQNTTHSLLSSIQLCGYDKDGTTAKCYPATKFNWQQNEEGWEDAPQYTPQAPIVDSYFSDLGVKIIDVIGNGLGSLVQNDIDNYQSAWINNGTGWTENNKYMPPYEMRDHYYSDTGARFVDFTGNGLVDEIMGFGDEKGAWANTGNGWEQMTKYAPDIPGGIITDEKDNGVRFLDLNGDGLVDIIQHGGELNNAWINNGAGWTEDSTYNFPAEIVDDYHSDMGVRLIDLNGNGKLDAIMSFNNTNKGAWINTGTGWKEAPNYTPEIQAGIVDADSKDNGVRFADLNGDGLVDMIQNVNNESGEDEAWINTGTGWKVAPEYKTNIQAGFIDAKHRDNGIKFVDLNGDGVLDIVQNTGDDAWEKDAWINTGTGWKEDKNYAPPTEIVTEDHQNNGVRFIDLNGNGLQDIVYNDANNKAAWINKAKKFPDMLIGITNGLGENTAIDYEPLSGTYVKVYDQEKKSDGSLDSQYPNPQIDGPMYVVYQTASDTAANDPNEINKLKQTGGAGAYNPPQSPYSTIPNPKNQNKNTENQHITTYHYTGARVNKLGWGFLGFHQVKITDDTTGINTKTTYSQDADNHKANKPIETDTYTKDVKVKT